MTQTSAALINETSPVVPDALLAASFSEQVGTRVAKAVRSVLVVPRPSASSGGVP